MRFEIDGTQFPVLPAVIDAGLKPPGLLFLADLEPILDENDSRADHRAFKFGAQRKKALGLLCSAKAHHALDTSPVVPASIEDHDLAGPGQFGDITLHVQLGLFALSRRRQGNHSKDSRAHSLRNALDDAALTRRIAPLKDDNDLERFALDAVPELDQL